MKYVDSLNKLEITVFKAFEYLDGKIPSFYKKMPAKDFMEWGERKMEFRKAIDYTKRILNIP